MQQKVTQRLLRKKVGQKEINLVLLGQRSLSQNQLHQEILELPVEVGQQEELEMA
jgi:hypothetical protein